MLALVIVAAGAVLLLPTMGLKLPAFLLNLVHVTGMSSGGEKPAVAIDGSIVFASPHKGGQYADIYLLDAQGTRRLEGHGATNSAYPVWSPDGTQIAYITDKWQLAVVKSDGSGGAFLTPAIDDPSRRWGSPAWLPDGNISIYVAGKLAVLRPDGSGVRVLALSSLSGRTVFLVPMPGRRTGSQIVFDCMALLVLRRLSLRCGERRVADAP